MQLIDLNRMTMRLRKLCMVGKLSSVKLFAGLLSVLLCTSCSFAPITSRVDAASQGRGTFKIQTHQSPTPSFGVVYGASDRIDVGIEMEQLMMTTGWARYSIINNPQGFSLATNAAVFKQTGNNRSNGYYVGVIASNQIDSRVRFTGAYRHAILDYEYTLGGDNDWFNDLDFTNPDDASVNGQLDLIFSYRINPASELSIGAACQHLYKNEDPTHDSTRCAPVVGLSFFRR